MLSGAEIVFCHACLYSREVAEIKQLIAEVCAEAGPRPAGSAAEERAARFIARELEARGAQVETEAFSVKPRALQVLLLCSCVGYIAAYGSFWFSPGAAMALLVLVLSQIATRTVWGVSLWDIALPKRTSGNVIGKINPSGDVQRVLIFAGHHDSAFRMPLLERRTFRVGPVMLLVLVASTLSLLGLSTWITFGSLLGASPGGGLAQTVILCLGGAGAVCAVVLPAGLVRADTVMGANDNLSAVAVALSLAEEASRNRPEHTELWFISFGSEEVGLVGSRAFVERHKKDLERATLVNLESFGQQGSLRVITSELMAGTRHDPHTVALVRSAARAANIAMEPHWLPGGLTDAASFSRKGLAATTVIRLDRQNYFDHYHNPGDDLPAIREEGLQEAFQLCVQVIREVDSRAGDVG